MNPKTALCPSSGPILEEGMLFVRTDSLFDTMVRAPLIVAGLIVVMLAMPAQNSFSLARNLDLMVYQDGLTHITSEFQVDSQQPDFEIDLFGSTIDNFVVTGEDGFLLESTILGDTATVETFGASSIFVEYDIHDLVSKQGRIWSLNLDAPIMYSLLMPENAVIVGMSNLPLSMDVFDKRSKLLLPAGSVQIDYIFGSSPIPISPVPLESDTSNDGMLVAIGAGAAIAGVAGFLYLKRSRRPAAESEKTVKSQTALLDPQTIFNLKPDLREDDREIVSFIFENGGQAKESELRKKFLLPRTTMWRAVKRLERNGIIEIEKKDQQNMVKLRAHLEEDQ